MSPSERTRFKGAGARNRGRLEPRRRPNLDGKATREDEPTTLREGGARGRCSREVLEGGARGRCQSFGREVLAGGGRCQSFLREFCREATVRISTEATSDVANRQACMSRPLRFIPGNPRRCHISLHPGQSQEDQFVAVVAVANARRHLDRAQSRIPFLHVAGNLWNRRCGRCGLVRARSRWGYTETDAWG